MGDGDAELRKAVAHEGEGAAIERLVGDDLVPGREEGPEHGTDRAHSRGQCDAGFGSFEIGAAALQQIERRVRDARVDVTRSLSGKDRGSGLDAVEGEGRGQVQGRGQSAAMLHRSWPRWMARVAKPAECRWFMAGSSLETPRNIA